MPDITKTKLVHGKRLLRVRGGKDVYRELEQKKSELAQLVREAQAFYTECQAVKPLYSITYTRKAIHYIHLPPFNLSTHHIPMMMFVYWDSNQKRQAISDWVEMAERLNRANVSLDERLLHIQMWYGFKDYYYRGRQLASDIQCLGRLKNEMDIVLGLEKLGQDM